MSDFQIFRRKSTKLDFGWAASRTPLRELTALPIHPSGIKGGLLLRRRGGEEGDGRVQGNCEGSVGREES